MKVLILILVLFSSYSHSHGHHGAINSHTELGAGILSLAWNFFELGMHGVELAGYKPSCSTCCQGAHTHGSSRLGQAYHIIELATHGLNLFDTTAKFSESISETIEEYISPKLVSASTFAFNLGVIIYRIADSKEQLKLASYGFGLWSLLDALGHANSLYVSSL